MSGRRSPRLLARRLLLAGLWTAGRPLVRTGGGEVRRVLVIRPDHLGDLLLAGPALHRLRELLPGAWITVLCGPWTANIVSRYPEIDEVLTCEFPGFTRRPKPSPLQPYTYLARIVPDLRTRRFDLALNLRFDFWWGAALAYLAGVPRRLGYAVGEGTRFLTRARPYAGCSHEVVRNLVLVEGAAEDPDAARSWRPELAPLRFAVRDDERWRAAEVLRAAGVDPARPRAVVHPGSGALIKGWAPGGFGEVAEHLSARRRLQVVLTGSADEAPLLARVAAATRAATFNLAGALTLGELGAVLEGSEIAVGVDSGPLHLAVALGTPSVHLYGPSDAVAFGPWGDAEAHRAVVSHWACVPCRRLDYDAGEAIGHDCVLSISPRRVIAACEGALAARATGGR